MVDFVVDVAAEIAEFFLDFWVEKVIGRFTKKKRISADGDGGGSSEG